MGKSYSSVNTFVLQLADELLADAHSAHEKAEEAVRLGDKTLREANETLITLKGQRTSSKKEMGEEINQNPKESQVYSE